MKEIRRCLTDFKFQELFIEHLGWNRLSRKQAIQVDEHTYVIEGAGEKSGLAALVCTPAPGEPFPGTAERKRLERAIEKDHHEHLIIFVDADRTRQIWSIPRREDGKTKGTSEIPFFKGKGVEHLARRVEKLSFSLDESESATLIDVSAKVNQALLAEKVTKKFFKEFSDQRKSFVQFLGWIEDESKRDWYCSVLLNRLMFIYFLGGKGFLPGGTSFLANNLEVSAKVNGPDTFYTHFLLPLSFFGLGERQGQRGRFEETFNDVLYLDGGLFAVHQVERDLELDRDAVKRGIFPPSAKIPDAEFRRWFAYFDKWRWTLDEDKVENDGYISPHILGYIFEKYINQKQMGAYYTKEDITGYICRNTIIPRLFDMLAETGAKGSKAVRPLPIGPHPSYMNEGRGISNGEGIDRYVYPSVKQEAKLPTETDYEQEQRRKRYEGILEDFDVDKIRGIDDFITYNLNIEKLAIDFVSKIQDPEVLHAFYFKGLQQITVLDPTCGSGAFLLSALNILYPIYFACLDRASRLVGKFTGSEPDIVNWGYRLHFDDLDVDDSTLVDLVQGGGTGRKILDDLRAEVERINDHPSAEYFIKKSIIVNNLFGVDIMEEAVEICKLRLFLSLIATAKRDDSKANFGVEPLPDIDFNILAGNTLVGFSTRQSIRNHFTSESGMPLEWAEERLIESVMNKMDAFQESMLSGEKSDVLKREIIEESQAVTRGLDQQLAERFGYVDLDGWMAYQKREPTPHEQKHYRFISHDDFVGIYHPFHWAVEFPSVFRDGGFQVIVGNPPYVETNKVAKTTPLPGYRTVSCGNLYAHCTERSIDIAAQGAYVSMIVQLPIACSPRMAPCLDLMRASSDRSWFAFYDDRPARLFDGLEHIRATIFNLRCRPGDNRTFSTRYHKWYTEQRDALFDDIAYIDSTRWVIPGFVPKDGSAVAQSIREKIMAHPPLSEFLVPGGAPVYYHNAPQYWMRFADFVPYFYNERVGEQQSSHVKELRFPSEDLARAASVVLNSSVFYWFFGTMSNCRDLTLADIERMRADLSHLVSAHLDRVTFLHAQLMASLRANCTRKNTVYEKTGRVVYDEFKPRLSAEEYFAIDELLFEFYEFDEEEREFIRNYDRRIRLGGD